jgi:hypothetical protein
MRIITRSSNIGAGLSLQGSPTHVSRLGWPLLAALLAVAGTPQTAMAAGEQSPGGSSAASRAESRVAGRAAIRVWTKLGDSDGTAIDIDIDRDDQADDLYDRARDLIEQGRFDRAIDALNRLIGQNGSRTDAALYWKAYTLEQLGQSTDALNTVADLYKRFGDSRWIKDARALEVEVRQSSGQPVSPDAQNDEELKLLALRGLMQSDPDQAFPVIEKILSTSNSPKVKDRALFVLSQNRSTRARDLIASVAKGNSSPDLQLKAVRYLGIMNGPENRQVLSDVYRASNDSAVKRAILRSFMVAQDRDHLLSVAKSEPAADLRGEAVRQLGVMHATTELSDLYQSEASPEVKKHILQSLFVAGAGDKLIDLAKNEKNPELRIAAIHDVGLIRRTETSDALTSIYASDQSPDVRKAVINALFIQQNAKALVALARSEKNPELKKDIVSKLSVMKSKDATDYLMELLK